MLISCKKESIFSEIVVQKFFEKFRSYWSQNVQFGSHKIFSQIRLKLLNKVKTRFYPFSNINWGKG